MAGSVEDLGAPESWEVADLDESMNRLMLSANKDTENKAQELDAGSASDSSASSAPGKAPEDAASEVDQFLREALQNPRERLSILRMEQDVQKFIRDSSQQQFEFQQLPTSYLRLAAHRVAQHYSLQSMVLLDSNSLDGSGSRIIVRKTSETRFPMIRLADIPVSLPSEESSVIKVSIKQRPNRHSHNASGMGQKSQKGSGPKSVEERKEEYNRARARIFNNSNSSSGVSGRSENETRLQDNVQDFPLGISKMEVKSGGGAVDANPSRATIDSSAGSSRSARSRTEKEPPGRNNKQNSRVAIFRDRDMDRSDPDYDRNYDRYTRRFDPGFGFSGGPYTIQPTFTPAMNYNTEFPQLRPAPHTHRPPQLSIENQHIPLPQHLSGLWGAPSNNPGIGYGHPETLMTPFSPNHVGARAAHLQPSHYSGQRPGMPFIHPHEHVHSIFSQTHQQQSDASSELARPW